MSNLLLWNIITASLWFSAILVLVLEEVLLMCHLPWKIVGLIHSKVVPRCVVHVIFVLVNCVESYVVPRVYTLAWISQQPVFGDSTWWWLSSSACLPIILKLDNYLGWSVSGDLQFYFPHTWLRNSWPPIIMLLVSTCAAIGLVYACKVHNLWFQVFVPDADWQVCAHVLGRTFPS